MTDLRIDWRQYFADFCEVHGKVPMTVGKRLVFPDGWSYAANDHKGPEWPPPIDPRERWLLVKSYWRARRFSVRSELMNARAMHESAVLTVQTRSAQITVVARVRTENGYESVRAPLNVDDLLGRVRWLEQDLALADEAIREANVELRLLRLPRNEHDEVLGRDDASGGAAQAARQDGGGAGAADERG